jgi:hypothetical protein
MLNPDPQSDGLPLISATSGITSGAVTGMVMLSKAGASYKPK